jgi:hypothetical protein
LFSIHPLNRSLIRVLLLRSPSIQPMRRERENWIRIFVPVQVLFLVELTRLLWTG